MNGKDRAAGAPRFQKEKGKEAEVGAEEPLVTGRIPGKAKIVDFREGEEEPQVQQQEETQGQKQGQDQTRQRGGKRPGDHLDHGERMKRKRDLLAQRRLLPIYAARETIIKELQTQSTLVLVGETGSGKTTQIPQFICEAGLLPKGGKIAITQPRRVAAITLASRVSEEMGFALGTKVGYSIRFDDCTSEQTQVKYMTDGMLMREVLLDPELSTYSYIILDEAHERTLRTDILFGLVKGIQRRSKGRLKIIVMSATLDAEKFSHYFNDAKILHVQGRQFPVTNYYTSEPQPDYVDAALVSCLQLHIENPPGDILVFLTGQEEIESLEKLLRENSKYLPPDSPKMLVCPLYAALPPALQVRVFEPAPPGTRKIILSTNIAETSVTINGIKCVIDSGFVKERNYIPNLGMETLQVHPISKSAARQRSGRAGRESAGTTYRLFTENDYQKLEASSIPEIKRCSLASVILTLKAINVNNVIDFDYMDKPPRDAIIRALEELYALGALDDSGNLTPTGKKMSEFPLEPSLSKVLLYSKDLECTEEVIKVIALLSVDTIFFSPKDKRDKAEAAKKKFVTNEGDHMTLLNALKAYLATKNDKDWCHENFINTRSMKMVVDVLNQLRGFCQDAQIPLKSCGTDYAKIRKCLLAGFFHNTAILQKDGTYKTLSSKKEVKIHPSSVLFLKKTPLIVYHELVFTSKLYIRTVSAIEPEWLSEVAPSFFGKDNRKEQQRTKLQEQNHGS